MKKVVSPAILGLAVMTLLGTSVASAVTIDFDTDFNGNPIASDTQLTSLDYAAGRTLSISATSGIGEAWTFSTPANKYNGNSNPANGDPDLLGPFDGIGFNPSHGSGYNPGNLLIVQENHSGIADDDVNATLYFDFGGLVTITSMDVMDTGRFRTEISLFDESGTRIINSTPPTGKSSNFWYTLEDADTGNSTTPNLYETVYFGTSTPVSRMEVHFIGSGAMDNIVVSAVPIPAAAPLFASALGIFGFMSRRRKCSI